MYWIERSSQPPADRVPRGNIHWSPTVSRRSCLCAARQHAAGAARLMTHLSTAAPRKWVGYVR